MRTTTLLLALAFAPPHARPADPPKAKPSDRLATLVKQYQAYELPLPPKEAKLFRFTEVRHSQADEKPEPPRVWLGFGWDLDKSGRPQKTLIEDRDWGWDATAIEEVKPEVKLLESVTCRRPELFFAVQCDLRGWHELAEAMFTDWDEKREKKTDAETWLIDQAKYYWWRQHAKPDTDLAKVVRRLQSLGENGPDFEHLKLSLVPSGAKPGSVEALIDELIDATGTQWSEATPDGRLDPLIRLGFDAVPELIKHLGDDRLTRASAYDGRGFPSYRYSIRHFTRDLLLDYMADDGDGIIPERGDDLDKEVAEKWWEEAQKLGEEKLVLKHVVYEKEDFEKINTTYLRPNLLRVIEVKHPQRLSEVVAWLNKEEVKSDVMVPVLEAVARSSLPKAAKKKTLLGVVASPDRRRKGDALPFLLPIEPNDFHRLLTEALEKLPAEPAGEFARSAEASFARVVTLTDSTRVWSAAEAYLKRAHVGVRMEWVQQLTWDIFPEAAVSRQKRIECVAKFLTDDSVRELAADQSRYRNTDAGYDFETIEVRNYAAKRVGQMLDLKVRTSPKWSADEWAKFRDEVATAVKAAK